MKRILWLLMAAVLLCGCTAIPQEESTAPPIQSLPEETGASEPMGIYVPGTEAEIRSGGAVRCYQPDVSEIYGLRLIGGDVLVFSGSEYTTLTRYTGDTLVPVGQITLDCFLSPEDSSFQTGEHGITYFDAAVNTLVYLGNDLTEVSRLELAEDLVGKPILSTDRTQVFYCTADAVRVYDTATGLDKLLKSVSYAGQTLEAVLLKDSVLRCDLTDDRGSRSSIFISSEDGRLIREVSCIPQLLAPEDTYCLKLWDGLLETVLFGGPDGENQALYPADPFGETWLLENAAVTVSAMEDHTLLAYYDLETGLRSASVTLPVGMVPKSFRHIPGSGRIWFLAVREDGSAEILSWDREMTPTGDTADYTGPRYTAKHPDEAGLAECAARAAAIGETYGIRILVGPEAAVVEPADYILEYEHQVSLLHRELEMLAQTLAQFPENFFSQLPGDTSICILRSITGKAQSGSVERARGIQFWDGEQAYVALEAGESLVPTFFHELFHIIDSKVLSTTRVYYHWENLNPEGCKYFQNMTSYLTEDVSRYLEGENRAFIDAYSMSYPREDRARIMEYACTGGNEAYFTSEIMQSKLETLCEGIRKAFGLEKYQLPLLWEQYLNEPLKIK